jgi:hypothetical protein
MRENEVSFIGLNDHVIGTENSAISFRVPHVVKGPKIKRAKNVVEKNTRKKKKSHQEKGTGLFLHVLFFSSISCLLIAANIFQMLLKRIQGRKRKVIKKKVLVYSYMYYFLAASHIF